MLGPALHLPAVCVPSYPYHGGTTAPPYTPHLLHPRWGNAAPPSHPASVVLSWRPTDSTAAAAHGVQHPVLCSGPVDPADGSFALPSYPLHGANLTERVDLDLVLKLVGPGGDGGQGQGQQEGGEALEQPAGPSRPYRHWCCSGCTWRRGSSADSGKSWSR